MNLKLFGLIASSGSAQVLLFLANFSLVFFYSGEAIAEYGFYITIGSLFSVLSSIRLDYFAFFSKADDQARELVLSIGLLFVGLVAVCFVLFCFVIGAPGERIVLLVLSIFSFSFYYLVSQHSLMIKDYAGYGWSRIILGVLFLVFLVAFLSFGAVGLLVGYCCAQWVSSIYLWRKNDINITFNLQSLKYGVCFRIRERLVNCVSTSIQFLSPALPMLLGSYFFDRETLGAFFWMSQMLGAAAAVVKRSLMGYLSAELMHDGQLQRVTIVFAKKLLVGAVGVSVISSGLALVFSSFTVGIFPAWKTYVEFLPMLVLLYASDALVQPLGSLLSSIQHENTHLLLEVARLISVLGCFGIVLGLDANIYSFAWCYSLVMTFFYFLSGAIFCRVLRSAHGV